MEETYKLIMVESSVNKNGIRNRYHLNYIKAFTYMYLFNLYFFVKVAISVKKCRPDAGLHSGLYSVSGKTSYRQISWSLEAAK